MTTVELPVNATNQSDASFSFGFTVILEYATVQTFLFVNHTLFGVVSVVGIGLNVINVVVFIKQGFQDTVNISLLWLALSDMMSLVTLLWSAISWNPLFYHADLSFLPSDVEYLTGSLPHLLFTRVTGWITAFVAFERCVCITLPLKVKTIITAARIKITIACVCAWVTACQAPSFYTSYLAPKFVASRNKTVMGLVFRDDSDDIDGVTYAINLVSPFGSFALVVACTVITAVQLKRKSRWRQKTVAAAPGRKHNQEPGVSTKEQRVIKMVVMISTVFIVSFTPANVAHIFYCAIAERPTLLYMYWDVISVIFSFSKLFESVNASVNFFLYYKMSTRYRSTLLAWVKLGGAEKTNKV